ncbi:MAG: hypothetical protein LBQ68_07685 [Clostridiales bacterium]|jgi:hypothetical protein|nr:hypothetical protein [Clostridiales bacterium]
MQLWDILFLVFIIVGVLGVGLYFLNRWASKRMVEQQDTLERVKQTVNIFIIDKKKQKPLNSSLPKEVKSKLPPIYRFMKAPLVKAKVGPQIVTLMSDPKVFDALPIKKQVKVELAGVYISGMPGMKTKAEIQALAKAKKTKAGVTEEKWYEKINPKKLMKSK